MTGKLGLGLVVSEAFARSCTRPMQSLGTFELKGIPDPAQAFAPQ